MKRGGDKRKSWKIACVTLIALLITLLIAAGTAQNVTELNVTLPIAENVPERNGTQPESITDLNAPIITILAPLNTTYNSTPLWLNYTINEPID